MVRRGHSRLRATDLTGCSVNVALQIADLPQENALLGLHRSNAVLGSEPFKFIFFARQIDEELLRLILKELRRGLRLVHRVERRPK